MPSDAILYYMLNRMLELARNNMKKNKFAKTMNKECGCIPLGDCVATPTAIPAVDYDDYEEEESTMNTFDNTDIGIAKNHMKNRITSHYYEAERALETKYLNDDPSPKTAAEIVERIKAGNIVLPDTTKPCYDEYSMRWQPYLGIRWRHPDKKVDRDGYDKAVKTLNTDKEDAITKITVLAPEAGLKVLESFITRHPTE